MKNNCPVGARDISTLNFLKENGVPSYFSGCLTLTLDKNPNIKKQDYIVTVDVPEDLLNFLKTKTNKKIYNITQMTLLDMNKPNEPRLSSYNSYEKFVLANGLLDLYQGANCAITNRLHVALPCLPFNTPILLINNYTYDIDRFSGLKDLMINLTLDEYISDYNLFDINDPPENKKDYLKLKNELIDNCKKFTGYVNNERTKFCPEDSNFYISLISNNSREFDKYNTKNNLLLKDKLNEITEKDHIINKKNHLIKKQNKKIKEMELSKSWRITKPLRNVKNLFK